MAAAEGDDNGFKKGSSRSLLGETAGVGRVWEEERIFGGGLFARRERVCRNEERRFVGTWSRGSGGSTATG